MGEPIDGAILWDTSIGNFTLDLFAARSPVGVQNIVLLCLADLYTNDVVESIQPGVCVELGNLGGEGGVVHPLLHNSDDVSRVLLPEGTSIPFHVRKGTVLLALNENNLHTSRITIVLDDHRMAKASTRQTVVGFVSEGLEQLIKDCNRMPLSETRRPLQRIRVHSTHVLHIPQCVQDLLDATSPAHSLKIQTWVQQVLRASNEYIANQDHLTSSSEEEDYDNEKIQLRAMERHRRKQEFILGVLGDSSVCTPENVEDPSASAQLRTLFVCRLNPLTSEEDLALFFSQFGAIESCNIVRDRDTQHSLQYAFITFRDVEGTQKAYISSNNVILDDRRIHVDFSQSSHRDKNRKGDRKKMRIE